MNFRTTAAYVSGAICGSMWMPAVSGGLPINANLRGPFGIMDRFSDPATFEDALTLLLNEKGGDFQNAMFTADTVIRIERRAVDAPGKYRVHVKEIELSKLVPDLVNSEAYTGDFLNDE